MTKKTIVLVGRPNVGKSTLFNRLTRSRRAIVSDFEGVTRDRYYSSALFDGIEYCVVDTGGLSSFYGEDVIASYAAKQTLCAIQEADAIFFIVDAQSGCLSEDQYISDQLRPYADKVYLVINKSDFRDSTWVSADFYHLGFSRVFAISAEHNQGVDLLVSSVFEGEASGHASDDHHECETPPVEHLDKAKPISIAVIGKPNVGKSSFINAVIGEERCIVSPLAGTTRDAVEIEYVLDDRPFYFIDTCGLRRRARIKRGSLENFSLIKTLQSIDKSDVIVFVVDAAQPIAEQDIHLASRVVDAYKPVVICANKCDLLSSEEKRAFETTLKNTLYFMDYAYVCYSSVYQRKGIMNVMKYVLSAYDASFTHFKTAQLMKILSSLVIKQQPPRAGRFRPKMKYIHQGGTHPPHVIIHGNNLVALPDSYVRYIRSHLREALSLKGVPLRLTFKSSENPYVRQDSRS